MKKNKKRLINYLFLTIVFTFILILIPTKPNLKATSANIRYISTSVGADETSVGINYQVDIEGSYVLLSTFSDFRLTEKYTPTYSTFSCDKINNDLRTGFNERYVCKLSICCLNQNTKYYFKVVAGEEESSVHSFKTYSPESSSCDILFTTDLHSAASYDTSGRGNTSLTNICNNGSIDLVVQTGDQVDRGGYESEWETFFNGYKLFNNKLIATIPGNHEYYHSSAGSYVSPLFYNQFFNNPQNGPEQRMNSTYTFTYGNIRFIMIDTINRQYLTEQKAWFRQVMENNTSQWVIVGSHAGCFSAGAYADDAKWMYLNWGPLFEEYQVDLALSGHEHIYIRKDLFYKNERNDALGITYLVGCAGSHKQYSPKTEEGLVVNNVNYSSNIIKVRGNELTCTLYDENGNETAYSFTLTAKRPVNTVHINDEVIRTEFKYEYDKENSVLKLNWPEEYYGNVAKVEIDKTVLDSTTTYTYPVSSMKMNSANLLNILKDYNYEFTFRIVKTDGTEITIPYTITNRYPHKLELILKEGTLDNPEKYTTYLDNAITVLPVPKLENAYFDGWYLNEDYSGISYSKIPEDFNTDLTFYGKFKYYSVLKYETNDPNQTIETVKIKKGDKISLPFLENDETKLFYGWHLKADFSDDIINEVVVKNDESITVYAEWLSLIDEPVNPEPKPTEEDNKNDNNQNEQTPQPETKKKCGKKSSIIIELLSLTSLLYFIIRKKH